ncbi:hypothetical protein HPB50_012089 [Hyalomma asiaticum]|uniref:Uncharacterized protein n=1 Tax=Hyalomma asiaticum TaxID=266040 RepID=A0ACB7SH81_HYAAI|nr:hypothetical protein HPB50_012089 [Hyalomma asiaticum]
MSMYLYKRRGSFERPVVVMPVAVAAEAAASYTEQQREGCTFRQTSCLCSAGRGVARGSARRRAHLRTGPIGGRGGGRRFVVFPRDEPCFDGPIEVRPLGPPHADPVSFPQCDRSWCRSSLERGGIASCVYADRRQLRKLRGHGLLSLRS